MTNSPGLKIQFVGVNQCKKVKVLLPVGSAAFIFYITLNQCNQCGLPFEKCTYHIYETHEKHTLTHSWENIFVQQVWLEIFEIWFNIGGYTKGRDFISVASMDIQVLSFIGLKICCNFSIK